MISMRSVESWVRSCSSGGMAFVLLFLILLQARAGWSQELAPPKLDEEFGKQENIYRSQGADVPSGYVTGRGLSEYAELLPSGFCDALAKLGSSDRWLDIGAGSGQAILDYYASEAEPSQKCSGSAQKARAVALSIEDRRTDKWREQAARVGDDRIRYLSGKRLRQYSVEELGKFQLISDVYGGFSYTEDLSRFIDKVLSLLEVGGAFYTLVQNVQLENGKDKPSSSFQTELVDSAGRDIKMCSWLKQTPCVNVGCESKNDWDRSEEHTSELQSR